MNRVMIIFYCFHQDFKNQVLKMSTWTRQVIPNFLKKLSKKKANLCIFKCFSAGLESQLFCHTLVYIRPNECCMQAHSSIHSFIHLSIHSSVRPSVHLFVHPSIHLPINSSIHLSIHGF